MKGESPSLRRIHVPSVAIVPRDGDEGVDGWQFVCNGRCAWVGPKRYTLKGARADMRRHYCPVPS